MLFFLPTWPNVIALNIGRYFFFFSPKKQRTEDVNQIMRIYTASVSLLLLFLPQNFSRNYRRKEKKAKARFSTDLLATFCEKLSQLTR